MAVKRNRATAKRIGHNSSVVRSYNQPAMAGAGAWTRKYVVKKSPMPTARFSGFMACVVNAMITPAGAMPNKPNIRLEGMAKGVMNSISSAKMAAAIHI